MDGRYGRGGQNNHSGKEEELPKGQYRVRFYRKPGGNARGREAVIRHIPWRRDNVRSHRQIREAGWYLLDGMTGMITRRTFHSR